MCCLADPIENLSDNVYFYTPMHYLDPVIKHKQVVQLFVIVFCYLCSVIQYSDLLVECYR